ncbi:MAG: ABC transporter ATP-binding protein [Solobacterium sp.]|jgi:putative ABC transport system ATP-binding protein|nr:ABC transporter ATP-binding protein [Solobacterium sp.]
MDEIILKTKNVRKVYNADTLHAVTALHDVNVEVKKGEFLGVMGPSGSGKSTFINMISTMDVPTDGKVWINGKNVLAMTANEIGHFRYENLGFIFQEFNLLDTHTIFENIALPLTLAKEDPREIEKRVTSVAEQLGIANLLDKIPPECSGGQRQRAAIARALINRPGLVVADEPTGNLDSENSEELMELFEEMNRNGTTIVMVTHDSYVASFTSRLIFIKDGTLYKEIERGDMDQDSYFAKIVEVSAANRRKRVSA